MEKVKEGGDRPGVMPSPNWFLSSIASYHANGLVSFGARNEVYIVDIRSQWVKKRLGGLESRISSTSFLNGSLPLLASSSSDKSIIIWNYLTGAIVEKHREHSADITCIASPFSPLHSIVSCDKQGKIVLWSEGGYKTTFHPFSFSISSISLHPTLPDLCAIGYINGLLVILNIRSGLILFRSNVATDQIQSLSFSPSHHFPHSLAFISKDSILGIISILPNQHFILSHYTHLKQNGAPPPTPPSPSLQSTSHTSSSHFHPMRGSQHDPQEPHPKANQKSSQTTFFSLCWTSPSSFLTSTSTGDIYSWQLLINQPHTTSDSKNPNSHTSTTSHSLSTPETSKYSHIQPQSTPKDSTTTHDTQNSINISLSHQLWIHAHSRTIFQLLPMFEKENGSEMKEFGSGWRPQNDLFLEKDFGSPLLPSKCSSILSISMDRNISLWNHQKKSKIWDMATLGGYIYEMASMPLDPFSIALASGDNTVRIWSLQEMIQQMDEIAEDDKKRIIESSLVTAISSGGNASELSEEHKMDLSEGTLQHETTEGKGENDDLFPKSKLSFMSLHDPHSPSHPSSPMVVMSSDLSKAPDMKLEARKGRGIGNSMLSPSMRLSPQLSPFNHPKRSNIASICAMTVFWKGITGKVTSVVWHPSSTELLAFGLEDGRIFTLSLSSSPLSSATSQSKSKKSKKSKNSISHASAGSPSPLASSHSQTILALSFVHYHPGDWMLASLGAEGFIYFHPFSSPSLPSNPSSASSREHPQINSDHLGKPSGSYNQRTLDFNFEISAKNPLLLRDLSSGSGKVLSQLPKRTSFAVTENICVVGNSDGSIEAYSWPSLSFLWCSRVHNRMVNRIRWLSHSEAGHQGRNHQNNDFPTSAPSESHIEKNNDRYMTGRAIAITGSEDGSIGILNFGLFQQNGNSSLPVSLSTSSLPSFHHPDMHLIKGAHSKSVNDLVWLANENEFISPLSSVNRLFFASCGSDGRIKVWSMDLRNISGVRSEGENEGHKPKHVLSMLAIPHSIGGSDSTNSGRSSHQRNSSSETSLKKRNSVLVSEEKNDAFQTQSSQNSSSMAPTHEEGNIPSVIIVTSGDDQSMKACFFPKDFSFPPSPHHLSNDPQSSVMASPKHSLDEESLDTSLIDKRETKRRFEEKNENPLHLLQNPSSDTHNCDTMDLDLDAMLEKQELNRNEDDNETNETNSEFPPLNDKQLPLKTRPKRKRTDGDHGNNEEEESQIDGKAETRKTQKNTKTPIGGPSIASSPSYPIHSASSAHANPMSAKLASNLTAKVSGKKGSKIPSSTSRHHVSSLFPDSKWAEVSNSMESIQGWVEGREISTKGHFLALGSLVPSEETSKSEEWGIWNDYLGDDVAEMIAKAVKRGEKISQEMVSLSASGGYSLWKATSIAYAEQLEYHGEYHKAATHYLAVRDIEKAISAYETSHRYQDAILVGLKRLGGGLAPSNHGITPLIRDTQKTTFLSSDESRYPSVHRYSLVNDGYDIFSSGYGPIGSFISSEKDNHDQSPFPSPSSFYTQLQKMIGFGDTSKLEEEMHPRVERSWRKWALHLSHLYLHSSSAKCFLIIDDIPSSILQIITHLNNELQGHSRAKMGLSSNPSPLPSLSSSSTLPPSKPSHFILPFQLFFLENQRRSRAHSKPDHLVSVLSPSSLQSIFWKSVSRIISNHGSPVGGDSNAPYNENALFLLYRLIQVTMIPYTHVNPTSDLVEAIWPKESYRDDSKKAENSEFWKWNGNDLFSSLPDTMMPSAFGKDCNESFWKRLERKSGLGEGGEEEWMINPKNFEKGLFLTPLASNKDVTSHLGSHDAIVLEEEEEEVVTEREEGAEVMEMKKDETPIYWLSMDAYILFMASIVWSMIGSECTRREEVRMDEGREKGRQTEETPISDPSKDGKRVIMSRNDGEDMAPAVSMITNEMESLLGRLASIINKSMTAFSQSSKRSKHSTFAPSPSPFSSIRARIDSIVSSLQQQHNIHHFGPQYASNPNYMDANNGKAFVPYESNVGFGMVGFEGCEKPICNLLFSLHLLSSHVLTHHPTSLSAPATSITDMQEPS